MTNSTPPAPHPVDVMDHVVGLTTASSTHAVRHQRTKVVAATQGSYEGMFSLTVEGISVRERLLVALHVCQLSVCPALVAHYRERLLANGAASALIERIAQGQASEPVNTRVAAMLVFATKLINKPIDGDRAAVQALLDAGLSTPSIVALGQLIAFLSYQVRATTGLQAMLASETQEANAPAGASQPTAARGPPGDVTPGIAPININGFTNQELDWAAWLDPVKLDEATPAQLAALDEMSPTARQSAYFLLLAHQSEILLQRSIVFNAIMFAPGGMPRAERELGATVESVINGCVYCSSVHARRFEQLAKRSDVIRQVFTDPLTAGTTEREKAIVQFSAELSLRPDAMSATHVLALRSVGLSEQEVFDLIHAVALFAWANRLMLNLGEPIYPPATAEAATR